MIKKLLPLTKLPSGVNFLDSRHVNTEFYLISHIIYYFIVNWLYLIFKALVNKLGILLCFVWIAKDVIDLKI